MLQTGAQCQEWGLNIKPASLSYKDYTEPRAMLDNLPPRYRQLNHTCRVHLAM